MNNNNRSVKWALEPNVVELEYGEEYSDIMVSSSSSSSLFAAKTPLKPSLKKTSSISPPAASPTPQPNELLEWAIQRHDIICTQGEEWRERGIEFRAKLVEKDEESGGNSFKLSNKCKLERYFEVAERVLDQFLDSTVDNKMVLTESYLVGNRLVKFLSSVLPSHHHYFSDGPNIWELRTRSQKQLVRLLQYLENLALVMDEEEYNKYILSDLKKREARRRKVQSPNKTADRVDVNNNYFKNVKVTDSSLKKKNSSPVSSDGMETAEEEEVEELFVDLTKKARPPRSFKDVSTTGFHEQGTFQSWQAHFEVPNKALLDDTQSDISEFAFPQQKDSVLFVSQDNDFMFQRKPQGSLVEDASSSLHSSSWDDSFSHFAKHHDAPKVIKKKVKNDMQKEMPPAQSFSGDLFASGENDGFTMVDDWGDGWTPSEGFEQRQNVFRQEGTNHGNLRTRVDSQQRQKKSSWQPQEQFLREHKSTSMQKQPADYVHPNTLKQLQEFDQPELLQERQQSPKSVAALPQWISWDEASSKYTSTSTTSSPAVGSYVPTFPEASSAHHLYTRHDDYDATSSVHSDEETQSLTRGMVPHQRTGPMRHMKGCVKCLLD